MTKLYKLIVGTFAAATLFTSVALADGFSVGILADFSTVDTKGNEQEGTTPAANVVEKTEASVSEDVEIPGIFAEVSGTHSSGLGMTFGIEYTPGSASIGAKSRTDSDSATSSLDDDGVYTAKAEIEKLLRIYVEPTFMLNESLGFYVKGGVGHVSVNTLETIDIGLDSSTYGDIDVWGLTVGAGVRAKHSSGLFAKLEYMETEWDTFELKSTNDVTIEVTELDQAGTRLAVGYSF